MRTMGRWLSWAIGLLAVAAILFVWFSQIEPMRANKQWFDRVRADIKTLAHKRPATVTQGQWEFVVGWTINLHGNCGAIWRTVEPGWRDEFATEFERRLAGPVSLQDVEWVWDEYAAHTTYGQRYSDHYRPTRAKEFSTAAPGCFGMPVD